MNLENKYCISSNNRPQHLFNFETLRCCNKCKIVLKTERPLYLMKRNYSYQISKLFVTKNNVIMLYSLIYSTTGLFFPLFLYLFHMYFSQFTARLPRHFLQGEGGGGVHLLAIILLSAKSVVLIRRPWLFETQHLIKDMRY